MKRMPATIRYLSCEGTGKRPRKKNKEGKMIRVLLVGRINHKRCSHDLKLQIQGPYYRLTSRAAWVELEQSRFNVTQRVCQCFKRIANLVSTNGVKECEGDSPRSNSNTMPTNSRVGSIMGKRFVNIRNLKYGLDCKCYIAIKAARR